VTEDLLFAAGDGIARVTFNRPWARNALTFAMYERLAEICAAVDADRSARAMVVTGSGGEAFSSGTDIGQFRDFAREEDALGYEAMLDRVIGALERCRVPTIAAVAGACTGAGAAIAAACDMRLAAANLRFGFPVARTLGNCLSMSNIARLASLIGPARVKDVIFTARLVAAGEARAIGLVSEVLDSAEALAVRADALARMIAAHAPLTLWATKEALLRLRPPIPPGEGADLIRMCYMSRDFREGMSAFLDKRPAHFTGE
jgi:enoyl-CoA hydratase